MPNADGIPTASDVVRHLNDRLSELGVAHRLEHIAVLPYVNPMWMANWDAPQLVGVLDPETLEEELREARWKYPQVEEDY